MKVLFLDIDGVLNSGESFHVNHQARLAAEERGEIKIGSTGENLRYGWPYAHLYTPHIENLNRIITETGAKIILSSTWRKYNNVQEISTWMKTKGFQFRDSVIGQTQNFNLSYGRGYEIQDWLNQNCDVEKFVILDDDSDMHHLMPYLIHCDGRFGLSKENADETIALLNGEIEEVANHEKRSEITARYYEEVWPKHKRLGN